MKRRRSERLGQLEGLTSGQVKAREAETFHLNERQARAEPMRRDDVLGRDGESQ